MFKKNSKNFSLKFIGLHYQDSSLNVIKESNITLIELQIKKYLESEDWYSDEVVKKWKEYKIKIQKKLNIVCVCL